MATIKRFEDIEAWQKARKLCKEIYDFSKSGDLAKDFSLRDQIRRSSGSIMDNIAEGFDREGNKEFIQFLSIAKGSASEVRSQLYRVQDFSYITDEQFTQLLKDVEEIGKMISGLMNYLKETEFKGQKYKTN